MIIQLPRKENGLPSVSIDVSRLVIIGANGSGKTRFGANIEVRHSINTHRISAQKSLSMPKRVGTKSIEVATSELLYGGYMDIDPNYYKDDKKKKRWSDNLNTSLLNDYEKLMVLLHTEEFEDALNYKEGRIVNKPITKLDTIQIIWEQVLPHRKLQKKAGVIEAYPSNDATSKYNGSELSDGERVIFYLIGEALCAPKNALIIFDEPEMHIHKSLIKKLFDLIEKEREDCAFIYLTHDIDFAFSREDAVKIWTKSYNGNDTWDYEILEKVSPIPEQLYLEILGSRRPIIFLEGEDSSIDYKIYEYIYTDYTLKPLGSCEKVIQSVKAFNDQSSFHHIKSFGIIDRDTRSNNEVKNLNKKGIWVLNVAEAENLFLLENVVKSIAAHMGKNSEEVFKQVKSNVLQSFKKHLNAQILLHYREILKGNFRELSNFRSKDISDAIAEIDAAFSLINKQDLFSSIKNEFESYLLNQDYNSILRVFNFKKALIPTSDVCGLTGIKNTAEYVTQVLMKLKKNDSDGPILKTTIDACVLK